MQFNQTTLKGQTKGEKEKRKRNLTRIQEIIIRPRRS